MHQVKNFKKAYLPFIILIDGIFREKHKKNNHTDTSRPFFLCTLHIHWEKQLVAVWQILQALRLLVGSSLTISRANS